MTSKTIKENQSSKNIKVMNTEERNKILHRIDNLQADAYKTLNDIFDHYNTNTEAIMPVGHQSWIEFTINGTMWPGDNRVAACLFGHADECLNINVSINTPLKQICTANFDSTDARHNEAIAKAITKFSTNKFLLEDIRYKLTDYFTEMYRLNKRLTEDE